ncbi:MAG: hypothetical protein WC962_06670, partial [Phycisphaerae bacterium]
MSILKPDESELIFDCCLGVAEADQLEKAKQLIESNPQAADLYNKLKASLSPLDEFSVEPCPDALVEKTISFVSESARKSSEIRLTELLAAQQAASKPSRSPLWVNIGKRLAMAATFMIVGSIILGTMNYMRYQAYLTQCQANQASIWQGISSYANNNQGQMPAVATTAGSPWWKVGDKGQENVSNTRHIWLLPKGGYVSPNEFLCPGSGTGQLAPITPEQVKSLPDFPSRNYISYSLRLICDKTPSVSSMGRKLIIADVNPLFENLPADYDQPLKLQMDNRLMEQNSKNHSRKGQNVLFSDGSVQFAEKRQVGINNDDMFTLRGTDVYQGVEMPPCETD